jgi:hypothetical protein
LKETYGKRNFDFWMNKNGNWRFDVPEDSGEWVDYITTYIHHICRKEMIGVFEERKNKKKQEIDKELKESLNTFLFPPTWRAFGGGGTSRQ